MRTAQRARWARFRVSVTTVVAIAILSVLLYLLTGGTLFEPKAMLITYLDDSLALANGAPVYMDGIKIGNVTSVELSRLKDPLKSVVVRFWVARQYLEQIPADSQTDLSSENVLGDKLLNIEPGKSPQHVRENGVLAQMPPSGMLSRLDITQFTAKLRSVDALFEDIQAGKGTMGEFVVGDQLYRDILSRVTDLQKDMDAAVNTKSSLGSLLYGTDTYRDLSLALQRLDGDLAGIQAGHGTAGKLLLDPAAYEEARSQVAEIRRAVEDAGQSSFLASDELFVSLNRGVAALIRAVDGFNEGNGAGQYLVNTQVYESLNGAAREMQSSLKEFRTDPRKFLRLRFHLF